MPNTNEVENDLTAPAPPLSLKRSGVGWKARAVGQLQEPGRPDSGRAVHGEVGAGEARVDELVIAGSADERRKGLDDSEEEDADGDIHQRYGCLFVTQLAS